MVMECADRTHFLAVVVIWIYNIPGEIKQKQFLVDKILTFKWHILYWLVVPAVWNFSDGVFKFYSKI
jgi:hypothetical protein